MKLIIYTLTIATILTSCGAIGGCSFSDAKIQNHTDKDIYVIIQLDYPKNAIDTVDIFLRFEGTKLVDLIGNDTAHCVKTYRVKSNGNLTLYEGPGSNPKFFMKNLKIVTDKEIRQYNTVEEISDAFDSNGIENNLVINR
jgi:hypothetical protein